MPACVFCWVRLRSTHYLFPLLRQADDQLIVAAPMDELKQIDFGAPLHSLVIAGNVHVNEEEMIECYRPQNQPGLKPYVFAEENSDDEGSGPIML